MPNPRDFIDRMMAYEAGDLSFDSTIAFFQELIDSGQAWQLQGHYGRQAARLIELGYCHGPTGEPDPANGCIHEWTDEGSCCYCGARRVL